MNLATRRSAARRIGGRDRRGSAVVQAAIVLPFILLFLFGIMEYSRYVMLLQLVNNAAREGCRYAIAHTDPVVIGSTTYTSNDSDVTTKVSNMMGGQALVSQTVSVYESDALGNNVGTWQNAQWGNWITVKVTGNFQSVLQSFLHFGSTIPITAEAVMRAED